MALSLNGVGGGAWTGAVSSCTVTLNTAAANDVIVVLGGMNGSVTVSSLSSTHLSSSSWTKRFAARPSGGNQFEVWWAIAPSSLTSEAITVTYSGTTSSYSSFQVFSVSGANTSAPFITNGPFGISAVNTDASITTTVPNTFCFAGYTSSTTQTPTVGTNVSWVNIGQSGTGYFIAEYIIESGTVTSLDAKLTTGTGSQNGGVGDAIVAASSPVFPFRRRRQPYLLL